MEIGKGKEVVKIIEQLSFDQNKYTGMIDPKYRFVVRELLLRLLLSSFIDGHFGTNDHKSKGKKLVMKNKSKDIRYFEPRDLVHLSIVALNALLSSRSPIVITFKDKRIKAKGAYVLSEFLKISSLKGKCKIVDEAFESERKLKGQPLHKWMADKIDNSSVRLNDLGIVKIFIDIFENSIQVFGGSPNYDKMHEQINHLRRMAVKDGILVKSNHVKSFNRRVEVKKQFRKKMQRLKFPGRRGKQLTNFDVPQASSEELIKVLNEI